MQPSEPYISDEEVDALEIDDLRSITKGLVRMVTTLGDTVSGIGNLVDDVFEDLEKIAETYQASPR